MIADTIAAVSTPSGEGAIGAIRISGPAALKLLQKVFSPRILKPRNRILYHGWIKDGNTHIDEVTAVYSKGPATYTGEDTVEIFCHGGNYVTRNILELIIRAGARHAEKGEFTKRAFLGGRMDLTRAEAVIDIIKARTRPTAILAATQLKGTLGRRISEIRGQLVDLMAEMEVSLDFPDEIAGPPQKKLIKTINSSIAGIDRLIRTADAGAIFREGVAVAIIGRPNVGKSSLLNAILRHDRAIVTPVPGTTRDVLEEGANIGGIEFRISDTAGIRSAGNRIEKLGVSRAYLKLEGSDMVLLVLDSSEKLKPEDVDLINRTNGRKRIVVLNKTDKRRKLKLKTGVFSCPVVNISAAKGDGISRLEKAMVKFAGVNKVVAGNEEVMINLRHKQCLLRARESLIRSKKTLEEGMDHDLIAIDLKAAISALGEMTGEEVSDEVISSIFERFCVGK